MRLLMVEDDASVAEALTAYLERQGFVVDRAPTLAIAEEVLLTDTFDLVLLDRILPDGDGASLIALTRARNRPQRFLIVSARDGLDDRIDGLELGARDYVVKPFEPRELLARIRAALRQDLDLVRQVRRFGPLSHEVEDGIFAIDDVPLTLRRAEALVLAALMARPGSVIQRESLEARVYGYDKFVNGNSLESTISRLRKTLSQYTRRIEINAVRGIGYQLQER
jgi:DNA-binding response OmpR family regulator